MVYFAESAIPGKRENASAKTEYTVFAAGGAKKAFCVKIILDKTKITPAAFQTLAAAIPAAPAENNDGFRRQNIGTAGRISAHAAQKKGLQKCRPAQIAFLPGNRRMRQNRRANAITCPSF